MSKPPRRPSSRSRKVDVKLERAAGRAIVALPVDPRQAGLFDAPLPGCIKPGLPTLVDKPPIGPLWVHEIFSRTGDPTNEDFEDAVVIRSFGTVPTIDELLGAT